MNEYKKPAQIIALIVAAVWVFCITFIVCVKIVRSKEPDIQPAQQQFQTTTQAPTSTPSTASPYADIGNAASNSVSVGDPDWLIAEKESKAAEEASKNAQQTTTKKAVTTTAASTQKNNVPHSKSEIIKTYADAVNQLKQSDHFTLHKNVALNVSIDSITGGSVVQGFAENVIKENQPPPTTYTFVNGYDAATGETPASVLHPTGKLASVDESAVTSATVNENADGSFSIHFTMADETQTKDHTDLKISGVIDTINVESMLPSGAKLESVEINYTGCAVDASFDRDGRLTYIKHTLLVSDCQGSGSMALVPVSMELHGEYNGEFTVSY